MALPPILAAPKSKGPALPPILPAPKPARPRPAPPQPRTNTRTGANPRGVAITAPRPKPTINDHAARTLATGNNPRGVAIDHPVAPPLYQKNPGYQRAVINVFEHQSPAQQRAVVQGALKRPTFEGKLILHYVKQKTGGPGEFGPLAAAIKAPELGALARAGAGTASGAFKVLHNAASDIWNLAPGTVEGLYGIGKQGVQVGTSLAHAHFSDALAHAGNAVHMFIDPYVNLGHALVTDPAKALRMAEAHPVNTALMFSGAESLIGKGAGAAARSGRLGEARATAASTAREPLSLGTAAGSPVPIHEARSYSPDLIKQSMQKARESYVRARGRNPNVAAPKPKYVHSTIAHAFNIGHEAKLNRIVDEMTAVRQMAGRGERARAVTELNKAAPHKDVRNITSHILQGVVRTPETAVADITKEIDRLKAAQTGKRTAHEIFNRRQVRDLSTALQHPEKIPEAFQAAGKIRGQIHAQDAYLVAHGLLDPAQAARRAVLPYAMAHMGATYDHAHEAFSVPGFRTKETLPKAQDNTRLIAQLEGQLNAHKDAASAARTTLRKEEARIGRNRVSPWQLGRLRQAVTVAERRAQDTADSLAEAQKRQPRTPVTVRYGNTRTVTTDEILQHLKDNGVPVPAYVRHAAGRLNNPGDFYKAYKLARGNTDRGPLTGRLFQTGGYDHSFAGLAGQMASRAEDVTRASLHDKVISRLGIRSPQEMRDELLAKTTDPKQRELIRQGLLTKDEANHIANAALHDDNGNKVPGALELTPITVASSHMLGLVKDLQKPGALDRLSEVEHRALANAIEEAQHSTTRNVVLIPSIAAHRFSQQFAQTDSLLRSVGRVTQQFRRTVLPYSTHWMLQIGSEAGIRAAIAGALDPRYLRDGRALMKRLKQTETGRAIGMETTNATFYNAHDPLAVHNPNAGVLSSAAHAFPPTRVMIAAHNRYANLIGHAMYTLEHNARLMGLGKLAHREVQEFSRSWKNGVTLQAHALDELAHRMETNPALVAKLGRQIDDMFGKYNKFTPAQRAAIQSIAPFLPWYLNAAKYVFWNLPVHHPVSTALMASLRQTLNQDMKDGKQAPLNTYAMQELARISPWGIFTPDSTTPSAAGLVQGQQLVPGGLLPEVAGAAYNYAGDNSFGEGPLKGPHGDVKAHSSGALGAASESLLEAFLPLARYVREVREGGKPAYGTSTVVSPQPEQGKGQTSVPNRILNPFYSFNRAKAKGPAYGSDATASTSSSGGWGGGGSSSGGWGGGRSASGGWG